jgi:hypothetical protein
MNNTIKHLPNGDFEVLYESNVNASELVIQLHDLARDMKDSRIRKIADDLAEVAKDHSDKGYRESTHEKQAEFAKNRNYHYTNTDNPIDFPKQ